MKSTKLTKATILCGEKPFSWIFIIVLIFAYSLFFGFQTNKEIADLVSKYGSLGKIPRSEDYSLHSSLHYVALAIGGMVGGFFAYLSSVINVGLANGQTRKTIRRSYFQICGLLTAFLGVLTSVAVYVTENVYKYNVRPALFTPSVFGIKAETFLQHALWQFVDIMILGCILSIVFGVLYLAFTRFKTGIVFMVLVAVCFSGGFCIGKLAQTGKMPVIIFLICLYLILVVLFLVLSRKISIDKPWKTKEGKK